MNIRILVVSVTAMWVTACSTPGSQTTIDAKELLKGDEILSSSDRSGDFPKWAYAEPRFIRGGEIYVSGSVEVNADQSPSRGLDAALLIAKANLASEIHERLQSQVQYASEGMNVDPQELEQIVNQESELPNLNGIHQVTRWYAKVKVPSDSSVLVRYRCFALIALPLDIYKAQVSNALQKKTAAFTPDFSAKVSKSWDQFFSDKTKTPPLTTTASKAESENQVDKE